MTGHAVLITGASSGIGAHVARTIATRASYIVYAGVRRELDARKLEDLAIPSLRPILLDVTDAASVAAAVAEVGHAHPDTFYALINNAGIAIPAPLELLPVESLREQFEVNVFGMFRITRACLPHLRRSQGRLINIGSMAGRVTTPLMGAYSASKHAVEAISDGLRRELRRHGVTVSLVQPGVVDTAIYQTSKRRALDAMAKMSATERSAFQAILPGFARRCERDLERAATVEDVHDAVWHALTVRRPRSRYPVGRDARLGRLIRHLPDAWVDRLIEKHRGSFQ